MGLKLIYEKKDVRPEDCDKLVIWLKDGGNREGREGDEGVEKCVIQTRFLSTGETSMARSKTEAREKGKPGVDKQLDLAVRLASKAVVSIEPNPVDPDGNEVSEITPEVIRGLPDWVLFKISEHMNKVRKDQSEQEKNSDGSSDSA